jgi:hypothetical protein
MENITSKPKLKLGNSIRRIRVPREQSSGFAAIRNVTVCMHNGELKRGNA